MGQSYHCFYFIEEEAEAPSVFLTAASDDFWDFCDVWPRRPPCTAPLPVLGRILTVPRAGDPNPGARKNQKEKPLLGSSLIVIPKDDVH